jgi:threonine synthase
VTAEQRKLLSTLGGNVIAAQVPGSFDDCQALVKAAFRHASADRLGLTAANSINVGRLVPQSFYYVDAVRQGRWRDGYAFSVPSGNLGNLTGGLETGAAEPRPTKRTISSAMDVSLPNNLERLSSLTGGELERLRRTIWARSFDDAATMACMRRARAERGYLFDPHGAIGMLGAEAYRRELGARGPVVVLATAHPAKLPDVVETAVGERPAPPPRMRAALARAERIVPIEPELTALLDLLESVSGAVGAA